jgi:4-amino-4-deoxy-L-arabinose transferase-like glycosyltransferase
MEAASEWFRCYKPAKVKLGSSGLDQDQNNERDESDRTFIAMAELKSATGHVYRPTADMMMLMAIIAVATVARLSVLLASGIGLHGDEAQYWSWSQDLAWGYYTKPPMIAWLIGATTSVCGDAEWCARAGSPILHAGTSLLCGLIGQRLFDPRTGFWAGLLFLTLPAVSFSSAIISTDVPLLFFWSLALYALLRVLQNRSPTWCIVLGFALGLGLLSKYAMAYFLIGTVLACATFREHRWFLTSPYLFAATLPAGLLVMPNLAWNMANGWATVAHVGQNANLGGSLFHPSEVMDFLGEQAGVFGPLLLVALAWRTIQLIRGKADRREGWLLCFCLPVLAIVTVQALLSRANANWAATAYVSATIVVAGWAVTRARLWVPKISVGLHVAAAVVVALFFLDLPGIEPPVKSDPLRRMRGWPETAAQVAAALEEHPNRILLTDDRKTMASLLYYLRNTPWKPVMWDYDGHPDHHYELTARYQPRSGESVFLVAKWDEPRPILEQYQSTARLPPARASIGAGRERVLHLFTLDSHDKP